MREFYEIANETDLRLVHLNQICPFRKNQRGLGTTRVRAGFGRRHPKPSRNSICNFLKFNQVGKADDLGGNVALEFRDNSRNGRKVSAMRGQ